MAQQTLEYYYDRIRIDRSDLQSAVLQHVELTTEVMREATTLRWEAERAKQKLDEAEALVQLQYREDTSKKRTVDEIKALVATHAEVRSQKTALIQAKQDHDSWSTLAEAYKQRGYALRELVEIMQQEMTSDPATIANSRARSRAAHS